MTSNDAIPQIKQDEYLTKKLDEIYTPEFKEQIQEISDTVIDESLSVEERLMGIKNSYKKMQEYVDEHGEEMTLYGREDMNHGVSLMKYFESNLDSDPLTKHLVISAEIANLGLEEERMEDILPLFDTYSGVKMSGRNVIDSMENAKTQYTETQYDLVSLIDTAHNVSVKSNYRGVSSKRLKDRYNNLRVICSELDNLVSSKDYSKPDLAYVSEKIDDLDKKISASKKTYDMHKARSKELTKYAEKYAETGYVLADNEQAKLDYSKSVISSHRKLRVDKNKLSKKINEIIDSQTGQQELYFGDNNEVSSNEQKGDLFPELNVQGTQEYSNLGSQNPQNQGTGQESLALFPTVDEMIENRERILDDRSSIHDSENVIIPSQTQKTQTQRNQRRANYKKAGKSLLAAGLIAAAGIGGYLLGSKVNDHLDEVNIMQNQIVLINQDNDTLNDKVDTLEKGTNALEYKVDTLEERLVTEKIRNDLQQEQIVVGAIKDDIQAKDIDALEYSLEAEKVKTRKDLTNLYAKTNYLDNKLSKHFHEETYENRERIDQLDQGILEEHFPEVNWDAFPEMDYEKEKEVIEKKDAWYKRAGKTAWKPFAWTGKKAWGITKTIGGDLHQYSKNAAGVNDIEYANLDSVETKPKDSWEKAKTLDDVFMENMSGVFRTTNEEGNNKRIANYLLGDPWRLVKGTVLNGLARTVDVGMTGVNFVIPDSWDPVMNYGRVAPYLAKRVVSGEAIEDVLYAPSALELSEVLHLRGDIKDTQFDANLDGEKTMGDVLGYVPVLSQARQNPQEWEGLRPVSQRVAETLAIAKLIDCGISYFSNEGGSSSGTTTVSGGETTTPGTGSVGGSEGSVIIGGGSTSTGTSTGSGLVQDLGGFF